MEVINSLIEKHTWKSIRARIKEIQPFLFNAIDEIDPGSEYSLYLVKYPYGSVICDRGVFCVPNINQKLVPLHDSSISLELKQALGYSATIPLGLVMSNSIETYLQAKQRIIPGSFKRIGEFVSLWRALEEEKSSYHLSWTITAGARSIFMLPKVTDSASHKALKIKYGLKLPAPQELFDQWNIFTHIANHNSFSQPWAAELIFFSEKWFTHRNDKSWTSFYRVMLDEFWKGSAFRRNQYIFDSAFSIAQENKNLKPNPYLTDTVKHLIAIGKGAAPAFSPAMNDEAAPVSGLQKTYLEDYGIKKYAPVIMHLHHFNSLMPVYYSFQMPTTTVFSPKSRKLSSVMTDLHELKHIMESVMSEILKGDIGLEKTPLYDLATNTQYGYYHSDKDKFSEVLSVAEIQLFDKSFTRSNIDDNEYLFPEFGPFFRGCISISSKTK